MTATVLDRRAFVLGTVACAVPMTAQGAVTDHIFDMTNSIRADNKRPVFRQSNKLAMAATRYADVLAQTGNFSHRADGSKLHHRVVATGYSFRYLAENIAWVEAREAEASIAQRIVTGWMKSSGHRRNILDRKLTELGVGVAQIANRRYAVQVFGTRA